MILITLILSLVPGFAWLFFYLQEDLHPEPKRLLALTFLAGMASAPFALVAEIFIGPIINGLLTAGAAPLYLITLGFIEEITKFCAAYLAVRKNPAFDEPVDAMIYMVVAAMGFATVENIGAIAGGKFSQTALLSSVFTVTSIRLVGATLLHSLASALLGYYWAISIREFGSKKYLVFGILAATVLHAAFNYFIIIFGNIMYAIIFLTVVGFFVLGDFEKLKNKVI